MSDVKAIVEYAPGNEIEYHYDDGTFKMVEAGPWAVTEIYKELVQSVWYFATKEGAEEFHKLKYGQTKRKPKAGDVLMLCKKCNTYDIQEEFGLDLETEICTCPSCGAEAKVDSSRTVYL